MENPPTAAELAEIFYPLAMKTIGEARRKKTRFAYYTTADVGVSILRNKEMWMRNTKLMNDWQEFQYGFDLLNNAYKSPAGSRLNAALDSCFAGLAEKVRNSFNAWVPGIQLGTYISCISEHAVEKPSEDEHGRLSMWRAYGGRNGVAFILHGSPFYDAPDKNVGVVVSPVAYLDEEGFNAQFSDVVANIETNRAALMEIGELSIQSWLFEMFRMATLCTKHPGFSEEQEWRLLANPVMWPSPLYSPDILTVRGTPQTVLKIKLAAYPELGIQSLEPANLVERIIIGPCDAPEVTFAAFKGLLAQAGCDERTPVVTSGIPLRHF